jgi:multiple sugar transport system permease protein
MDSRVESAIVEPGGRAALRQSSAPKQPRRLRIRQENLGYLFVAPVLIVLLVTAVYPIVRTVVMSFQDVDEGVWHFVGLEQYARLIADQWFWNSLGTTVLFTTASTILHLAIGMFFALLLNERWFSTTLRNVMRGALILPWVFSTAAAALMWALLYHPFGLFNFLNLAVLGRSQPIEFLGTPGLALFSIIVVNTWKSYPFYMISILGGLQGIPVELYDAAKVDGATTWQRFRYVTLPQLRPVLVAVSTIDIITTLGHVDLVNMLTRGGPFRTTETVAYYIYKRALLDGLLSYGAAISVLVLLFMTVFTFFYLRIVAPQGEPDEVGF